MLAACPTCLTKMLAQLLPSHQRLGRCMAPGSGGDEAERARTVKEAVTPHAAPKWFNGEGYDCKNEWKRQKLVDHRTSGGTAFDYGLNVKARQKAFDDRCKQLRALASFRRPTSKISKYVPPMRLMHLYEGEDGGE